MSNFKDDILAAAEGEEITKIVIGKYGWSGFDEDKLPNTNIVKNKVLTWDKAAPMLDYEYSTGYGSPSCHAITAWTKKRVLFVSQYDGSTCVCSVPRNPVDHEPDMPGG